MTSSETFCTRSPVERLRGRPSPRSRITRGSRLQFASSCAADCSSRSTGARLSVPPHRHATLEIEGGEQTLIDGRGRSDDSNRPHGHALWRAAFLANRSPIGLTRSRTGCLLTALGQPAHAEPGVPQVRARERFLQVGFFRQSRSQATPPQAQHSNRAPLAILLL